MHVGTLHVCTGLRVYTHICSVGRHVGRCVCRRVGAYRHDVGAYVGM